jgi:hypothetical protein
MGMNGGMNGVRPRKVVYGIRDKFTMGLFLWLKGLFLPAK